MICGENVGVVAPEVRSRSPQSVDGEIEFESVSRLLLLLLLLFAVSSHTLTRAISDGFLPWKSAAAPAAAVLKRSARSLAARELWLLRELEQRLRPRPRPPPPLCSLIKLSPFKSVTVVRASVSNLRAAAADCREGRRGAPDCARSGVKPPP